MIGTRLKHWPKTKTVHGPGYRYLELQEKMPACPDCGRDEMVMLTGILIECKACGLFYHKDNEHGKQEVGP